MSHFYIPRKRQKTFGFLTFSGSIEMWHWTKMGSAFVTPTPSFTFSCHNPKWLKLLIRLCLGLSYLPEHDLSIIFMTLSTPATLAETVTLKHVVISSSIVSIPPMKDWPSWAPYEILILLLYNEAMFYLFNLCFIFWWRVLW